MSTSKFAVYQLYFPPKYACCQWRNTSSGAAGWLSLSLSWGRACRCTTVSHHWYCAATTQSVLSWNNYLLDKYHEDEVWGVRCEVWWPLSQCNLQTSCGRYLCLGCERFLLSSQFQCQLCLSCRGERWRTVRLWDCVTELDIGNNQHHNECPPTLSSELVMA